MSPRKSLPILLDMNYRWDLTSWIKVRCNISFNVKIEFYFKVKNWFAYNDFDNVCPNIQPRNYTNKSPYISLTIKTRYDLKINKKAFEHSNGIVSLPAILIIRFHQSAVEITNSNNNDPCFDCVYIAAIFILYFFFFFSFEDDVERLTIILLLNDTKY